MRYGLLNNFSTTLATAPLAAGETTMNLSSGGANFADASSDYRYKLTLVQKDATGVETQREIVDVVGASGNVLTIEGEKEGTTRLTGGWPIGTTISARLTAEMIGQLQPLTDVIGTVDFTDPASTATWDAPAGSKFFVDSLEVVPLATTGALNGWSQLSSITQPDGDGESMALSPDGTMLAVGTDGNPTLTIYNTADWTVVAGTPNPGFIGVFGVAWSPDGTMLAVAGSSSPGVIVYNTADWTTITGTPVLENLRAVGFTTDSAQIICPQVGAVTPQLGVYNTADWTQVTVDQPPSWCWSLAIKPDGTEIAVGHDVAPRLTVIETTTWTTVTGTPTDLTETPRGAEYSNDGTKLALSLWGAPGLAVYNTGDWSSVTVTPTARDGTHYSPTWSPDDTKLAIGYTFLSQPYAIYDTATWTEMAKPTVDEDTSAFAWLDANTLAMGHTGIGVSADGVTLWANGITPSTPRATVNLGTSVGNPATLLSATTLDAFYEHKRIPVAVDYADGVTSLHVSVAAAEVSAAQGLVLARGYTIDV